MKVKLHKRKQLKQTSMYDFIRLRQKVAKKKMLKSCVSQVLSKEPMKCAQKRWSALIIRIGRCSSLRIALGENNWSQFVKEARAMHYRSFLCKFSPANGIIKCTGPLNKKKQNDCCNEELYLDLNKLGEGDLPNVKQIIRKLHLDHEFDIKQTCELWSIRIKESRASNSSSICNDWAMGMSHTLLLWLLFQAIEFCCFKGDSQTSCHGIDSPRYTRLFN